MTATTLPPRISPATPCAHCGLPVGEAPLATDAAVFCCTGCEVVHGALHASGLDASYYALRTSGRPARAVDADAYAVLDQPDVLDDVATRQPDGTLRATLHLEGAHCAACVWLVERLPHHLDGVLDARLNLARGRLDLAFDPARASLSRVAQWLARFGYRVVPAAAEARAHAERAERTLLIQMGVSWALAGNAMLLAFAFYAGLGAADGALDAFARYLSWGLATASYAVGGRVFFRSAWQSLQGAVAARDARLLSLDLPISLGLAAGYAHSAYTTVAGVGPVWFDSLLTLVAALLTARWLHGRALRHAREASDRLLTLLPTRATRLHADGTAETVVAARLAPGDVVRVEAGEVVPIDGVVVRGESVLDCSVLTGESAPVATQPGRAVDAGATNLRAALNVRVTASGEATRVGALLATVQAGAATEAPTVRLADALAPYYVAALLVLLASALAMSAAIGLDDAVQRAVALLVITCPCALGMATPLSFAAVIGRAARDGLFVKHGAALEHAARLDAVVLDKTGTLTEGQPTLAMRFGADEALAWAAALEHGSVHPIAQAFGRAYPHAHRHHRAEDVQTVVGRGVEGWVGEAWVRVGRPDWAAYDMPLSADLADGLRACTEAGLSPVGVSAQGALVAVAGFGDALRSDARAFVASLQNEGHSVWLLSGDAPEVVDRTAHALGIPAGQARGHVTPEEKAAFVRTLSEGMTTMMLGDGVNDAAALQAAHVGVAVAGGTTVSVVAADVFATASGLAPVRRLVASSTLLLRRVRALLGFSVLYNVAGVGLALAGLVTPLAAAVAMPLSSLVVVAGALRPLYRPARP